MAVNESVTLFKRSQSLTESIDQSIKNCGNIKSSEKANIIECINGLNKIIKRQNQMIVEAYSTSEDDFKIFVTQQRNVNKDICERLDELKNSLVTKQSYSTVLKSGQQSLTDFRDKRSKNVVIIKSKNNAKDSKELKMEVRQTLNRTKANVTLKNIRDISKGKGLAIDCETDKDSEELIRSLNSDKALEVSKPKLKLPKIAVYGVDSEFNETNIVKEICYRNENIQQFLQSQQNKDIDQHLACKFKFRKTRHDGANTWVLEVSPQLRQLLIKNRKVKIGYNLCRFSEYLQITRCFGCQQYGHIRANCPSKEAVCGNCGGKHETKTCDPKKVNILCVNCDRHNKNKNRSRKLATDHTVFSSECESFRRIVSIVSSKINYG